MALAHYEDFHPLVGRAVRLRSGTDSLEGRLESVRRLPEHSGQPRRPFSVVIVTERPDPLPQQIFEVEIGPVDAGTDATGSDRSASDMHGPIELFLVPIGPSAGGMAYEAVFA